MNLVQIVPRLPPSICGVGDYSVQLGAALTEHHGVESSFVVCDPSWDSGGVSHGNSTVVLRERTSSELFDVVSKLNPRSVLLQYSNYGYHKRGTPFWLVRAIRQLSIRFPVITFFHELSASGPIWSSSFWLGPEMLRLAKSVSRMSRSLLTSRSEYAKDLGRGAFVIPIFSAFGESDVNSNSWKSRDKWLACFGYQYANSPLYVEHLSRLVRCKGITRVISIGRKVPLKLDEGLPRFEQVGVLDNHEVSAIISKCKYGFIAYNTKFLAKSSILASFAAHGLAVYSSSTEKFACDGIESSREIGIMPVTGSEGSDLELSNRLNEWYLPHNIKNTARQFYKTICAVID